MNSSFECYIVVWHDEWKFGSMNGGHEGVDARSTEEATRRAQRLMEEGETPAYAFNAGQVRRMIDAVKALERTNREEGYRGYVVFYLAELVGVFDRCDVLKEGWITVRAESWDEAVAVAGDKLEITSIPFLAYESDDLEMIWEAMRDTMILTGRWEKQG